MSTGLVPHEMRGTSIPLLTPRNYKSWKIRMRKYLMGVDYQLWVITQNGLFNIERRDEDRNVVEMTEAE